MGIELLEARVMLTAPDLSGPPRHDSLSPATMVRASTSLPDDATSTLATATDAGPARFDDGSPRPLAEVGAPVPSTDPVAGTGDELGPPPGGPGRASWTIATAPEGEEPFGALALPDDLVLEVEYAHDSLATAQVLPDDEGVIRGTLRPSDRADLYMVPASEGAGAYAVRVRPMHPEASGPGEVWLYDGTGAVLAHRTLDAFDHDLSLILQAVEPGRASSFYLGVGPSEDEARSASPTDYLVQIAPMPSVKTIAIASESPSSPAIPPPETLRESSPARTGDGVEAVTRAPIGPIMLGRDPSRPTTVVVSGLSFAPTGLLPSRVAAPVGGVLTDGEIAPRVDRSEAAAIDPTLIDLPVIPGRPSGEAPPPPGEGEPLEGLVAEGGGVGPPLLEATAPPSAFAGTPTPRLVPPPRIAAGPMPVPPIPAIRRREQDRRGLRTAVIGVAMGLAAVLALASVVQDLVPLFEAERGRRTRRRG